MLASTAPQGDSAQDLALQRLIQAERLRMLFAPTAPVALVSVVFALALGLLVGQQAGWTRTGAWVTVCVGAALLRLLHLRAYQRHMAQAAPTKPGASEQAWLRSLTVVSALHGLSWGLAGGWLIPANDLVTIAVIVAVLVGGSAVSTFTLQAHMGPNLAVNLPMLLPAALALALRQDRYGLFGCVGLLSLLSVMLFESRRAERRITELLWLRFTTDRIAQERAQALTLAHRHSAIKDQFLATMSHEMRTPLHGILGLARLLQQRLPARAGVLNESRQQVELIEHAGEHLLTLINDVLDFSRIEAGRLQVEQTPFELGHVVHDVLGLLRVTAQEKGLALQARIELPSPCWVVGDAARVRQVLHNLVGNAIKFTEQGEVCVEVARASDGSDAPPVCFEVRDTGIGIPAEELPLIFEAFHQVDSSFGRRHKGTGLGLTISREIARAMGGDIVCQSQPAQGSVFTLSVPLPVSADVKVDLALPLGEPDPLPRTATAQGPARTAAMAPAQGAWPSAYEETQPAFLSMDEARAATRAAASLPASPTSPTPWQPAPPPPARILLAEDNAVNAMVAEATLANLGVVVLKVDDGEQALAQLTRLPRPFDLVLMDCQMPVLDGIEATRRLREWERAMGAPRMTVVALTANAMSGDRARCLEAGMDDHLAKPFRQDALQAVLARHLRLPTPTA